MNCDERRVWVPPTVGAGAVTDKRSAALREAFGDVEIRRVDVLTDR